MSNWDSDEQSRFIDYFGVADESARKQVTGILTRMLAVAKGMTLSNYKNGESSKPTYNTIAFVRRGDKTHTINLADRFYKGRIGKSAHTVIHEMSHFKDIGDTYDYSIYGDMASQTFALMNRNQESRRSLTHAGSLAYYVIRGN